MIRVERLPCPAVLNDKAETWTEKFLDKRTKNPGYRPLKSQYAHDEIVSQLVAMSHGKCFYCETKLDENDYTVDHHVEVSEDPSKAFAWSNLYLSCHGCQNKLSEHTVARVDCVDPCEPDIDPAEHLRFEDEIILKRAGSRQGQQTIRKYKLNRDDLQLRRSRQLKRFYKRLLIIRNRQIQEQRQGLTTEELEQLCAFQDPEHGYSLMFRHVLANAGIHC